VFEDYNDLQARMDDPKLDVDARLRDRAQETPARVGAPRHARVGSADPEEAAPGGGCADMGEDLGRAP